MSEMFGVVGEEKKIGMLTWRGAAAPPWDRRRLSPDFSSPRTFSLPDPSLYMQHITTNDRSGRRRYYGGHVPLNIPAQYSFSSLVRVPLLQLPNLLNTRFFCRQPRVTRFLHSLLGRNLPRGQLSHHHLRPRALGFVVLHRRRALVPRRLFCEPTSTDTSAR